MVAVRIRFIAIPLLVALSCTFERNNPYDPHGDTYRPLSAPPLVSLRPQGDSLRLTWVDHNTHEYGYRIFHGPDRTSLSCVDTVAPNQTTCTFLAPDVDTLYYAVAAFAAPGEEVRSVTGVFHRPAPPVAPTGVGATPLAGGRVALLWWCDVPCDDSLLILRTESTTAETLIIDSIEPGTGGYIDATPMKSERVYTYHMAGFRGDTLSSLSSADSFRTGLITPFAVDTNVVALYRCDTVISGVVPNTSTDSPDLVTTTDSLVEGRFDGALFLKETDSSFCDGLGAVSYPFTIACFLRPARDLLPMDTMAVWGWEDESLRLVVAGGMLELLVRDSVIVRLSSPLRANRWAAVRVTVTEHDMELAAGDLAMTAVSAPVAHPRPSGRFHVGGRQSSPAGWRGGIDEFIIERH